MKKYVMFAEYGNGWILKKIFDADPEKTDEEMRNKIEAWAKNRRKDCRMCFIQVETVDESEE